MSSVDLKFEVGDLVIPNFSVFKGDECRIVKLQPSGFILVETLNHGSFNKGHTGSGTLSQENGWNYEPCDLVHSFRDGFKIGDRVGTFDGIGAIRCFNKQYGSIGVAHDEVVRGGHDIDGYCKEGYGRFYTKDELSHSTEEPELPFKVGDRVKINPGYMNRSSIGVVKTVKDQLTTTPMYGVEFSEYNSLLHNLDGDCASGHGWYYSQSHLELVTTSSEPMTPVTPVTPEKRFTVGQKVTYKPESSLKGYRYRGIDQGGFVGEIKYYLEFISDANCYKIRVTERGGDTYLMLESEFEDYFDPAFTAKKASIPESAFTSTSASKPTERFKVGDKVTYKPKNSLPGSKYNFGGEDQGFFVGTIKYYASYYPEYGCYPIDVSTKEGGMYSMLESEFFEYDGIGTGYTTIGSDSIPYYGTTGVVKAIGSAGSTTVSPGMWAAMMEKEFEKRDEAKKQDLSEYIQAPSVPKKKSTKRKLVIVDRF